MRYLRFAFLCSAAMVASIVAARAADMPGKVTVYTDPSVRGWAGAYLGVTAGYGWTELKATTLAGIKADPNQFMPGGVAGYRWGKQLTFGLEMNGIYAGHSDTIVPGVTGKLQYLGDVTAQLGLALNNGVLLYAGAGPAFSNSQVNIGGLTSSANNFGWVARAGFDVKLFSDNWVGGIAYAHYALGDSTYFGVVNASSKADVVQARLVYRFGH